MNALQRIELKGEQRGIKVGELKGKQEGIKLGKQEAILDLIKKGIITKEQAEKL